MQGSERGVMGGQLRFTDRAVKVFFSRWPRAVGRGLQAVGRGPRRAAGRGSGGGPRAATAPGFQKAWVRAKPQTLKTMGGCEALHEP